MLYLVRGTVHESHYPDARKSTPNVFRIVEASDERECRQKFDNHFQAKSKEYSVSYYADVDEMSEVIV